MHVLSDKKSEVNNLVLDSLNMSAVKAGLKGFEKIKRVSVCVELFDVLG